MQLRSLVLASAFLSCPFAADSAAQLKSTLVTSGLTNPIGVVAPPGDTLHLYVLERAGPIRVLSGTVMSVAPFLDLTPLVSTAGEGGLLGLAFHPDYANNKRFFVSYASTAGGMYYANVVEYAAVSATAANTTPVATIFGPYLHGNAHYSGDLHFGLDGKLYYTLGHGNGLPNDLTIYDGKMLRIDIDLPPTYVPVDNPFPPTVGGAPDLTWALGLRNPFRFSFDRLTAELYIGDVGSFLREEIDFQPKSVGAPATTGNMGGRDYGFACMEGTVCTNSPTHCFTTCPSTTAGWVPPVHDYAHVGGVAVIGGFAYRGSAIPGFQGRYFYADFGFAPGQTRVASFVVSGGVATGHVDHTVQLQGTNPNFDMISSFGEDADGELYVTTFGPSASVGSLFRIEPVTAGCPPPVSYCTTSPNWYSSGAIIGSTGSASIAAAELALTVRHCPPSSAGLFFSATATAFAPFGNGILCVGGTIVRLPVDICDEFGNAERVYDYVGFPVTAGTTQHFQFYYRDSVGGTPTFNLSDGRSVTFCP